MKRLIRALPMAALLIAFSGASNAAVTAGEAARLQKDLTPMGAERAGNADGSIPEWKGGNTKAAAPMVPGKPRPDPFPGDKPLFSITKDKLKDYEGKLSQGTLAMFKKYPDWKMQVYPTRRSAAAPDFVYKNTAENAVRTKISKDGLVVENAYGGVPFPIPKTGAEVVWNHLTAWKGASAGIAFSFVVGDAGGNVNLVARADNFFSFPYYDINGSLEKFKGTYAMVRQIQTAPAFAAGGQLLFKDPLDSINNDRAAYFYLPGQRRARVAPDFAFDQPYFLVSGVGVFDEALVFNGSMERYTWKLLGKKEMYVPYHQNRLVTEENIKEFAKPHFVNPELVRWELHRVWVVEAQVREGSRHVVAKREMYVDEDTWTILISDNYDARGQIWRSIQAVMINIPELPGTILAGTISNNILEGSYYSEAFSMKENEPPSMKFTKADAFFTAEAMAGAGVR